MDEIKWSPKARRLAEQHDLKDPQEDYCYLVYRLEQPNGIQAIGIIDEHNIKHWFKIVNNEIIVETEFR